MKKAQKQEMLEMVQTLHQAHDEIKENIDRKNFILAQDMLSQCQECAISIGNAIEKLEGEGFVTVPFIEAYCDVLFTTFEELNGSDANANKIYKNLKKQLLRIENSIKNDVPIRKEVAFFPYKASMWDSLESVYLAAKEDPDCDAYCVPIPYYDRNADGSLGKMHYEGREYPKNIEVIDWQTYNFEERKPDTIYIHNPYDDWNLVTCVHPRYFSANLKKYTDKLVYIPYFVLDEIEPDDQARIDNMKHFVWTPGVVNADKVVVQSEKMKQIYINEYLKAAQKNGLQGKHTDRKYLEEKFLGTGSPKFDKVLNTKKEDLEIPEEWLKIIEKPDGSWKKIIFYNTSIAALLENNEKMLEKMKDVFRIFKENKDEVVLLWRPHPLIKSTVSAMRPQLWTEYEKIVNQYKEEGWGIYDDSSDMDRAVVLSDAYYGDMSSVVQVYQKTGKLVMIQNVTNKYQKDISKYSYTFSACNMKEDIVLSSYSQNELLLFNKQKKRIYSQINLGKNKYGVTISDVISIGDYVVTAPFYSYDIYIYNIKTKELMNKRLEKDDIRAAYKLCKYNDEVWFLPVMKSKYMYSYNIDNDKFEKYLSVFEKFLFDSLTYSYTILSDLRICNDTFFFAERYGKRLFKYKIGEQAWTEYYVHCDIVDFIVEKDNEIWCLNSNSELFLLNDENEKYPIDISTIENKGKLLFSHIILVNNSIWCIPDMSDSIMIFDIESKLFTKIKIYENTNLNRLCNHYITDQNNLYIFSSEIEEMWIVDIISRKVQMSKLLMISNNFDLFERSYFCENELPLQSFLSIIV